MYIHNGDSIIICISIECAFELILRKGMRCIRLECIKRQ